MEVQQLSQVKDEVITPPPPLLHGCRMVHALTPCLCSRQGTKWGGAALATAAPVMGATKTLLPADSSVSHCQHCVLCSSCQGQKRLERSVFGYTASVVGRG